ncbi:putative Transcriptional regulator araC family [Bradyrhizobium sp. ORS 285]|uniref:AraC family transcriptional regulator n=1 Tax=Bradyrhizobium sp. ORS 285 TaxID=115808 RepID=UPI00024089A7|nr:AraC family transcriptional regulator [Bradyrhizobium sp. ORS 285]CCD86262.1 putative Transcriptional regulator araC family [Bradyrhizobium sp. ORS 285]SMX61241.1 putative Transcriptional regulator araC family [Bradyrhizobium sp. ORS 285]
MKLSQSSKLMPDPLSNVLDALGARVTRRTRLEAAGNWALAFPAMDRLKFVAVLRGTSWMLLPSREPQYLQAGDVCLLGRTPYVVASDPTQTPIDGKVFYGASGCDVTRFGGDDTIGIGGTVKFAADNAGFLLDLLPDFLLVSRTTPASRAIATILSLMNDELQRDRIGGEVVSARLADLLLVEAIRAFASRSDQVGVGWLGALSDPRLGRVLRAIHQDVSRRWTVEELANVAGMSRAAFSATFMRRLGQAPLAYLRAWRLTIARAALARGGATVATIASKVGYESQSAFAHAFKREFGISPKAGLA